MKNLVRNVQSGNCYVLDVFSESMSRALGEEEVLDVLLGNLPLEEFECGGSLYPEGEHKHLYKTVKLGKRTRPKQE